MVSILLADGFEESEALITADLLSRAGVEVTLTGLTADPVVGSHKIWVIPDASIEQINPDQLEMLVLPGGLGGVSGIESSKKADALIKACFKKNIYLAAICAAPTILANMGLLDGVEAVCYPGMEDQMGSAVCTGKSHVVVSDRIITGEACGSTFPFALTLVSLLKGNETAERIKHEIHYHS